MTTEEKHGVENWTPYTHYTWSNAALRSWYHKWGAFAMYDGKMWRPKVRKLHVGMNEVRWEEYNP